MIENASQVEVASAIQRGPEQIHATEVLDGVRYDVVLKRTDGGNYEEVTVMKEQRRTRGEALVDEIDTAEPGSAQPSEKDREDILAAGIMKSVQQAHAEGMDMECTARRALLDVLRCTGEKREAAARRIMLSVETLVLSTAAVGEDLGAVAKGAHVAAVAAVNGLSLDISVTRAVSAVVGGALKAADQMSGESCLALYDGLLANTRWTLPS
jgi:hypothetical protein